MAALTSDATSSWDSLLRISAAALTEKVPCLGGACVGDSSGDGPRFAGTCAGDDTDGTTHGGRRHALRIVQSVENRFRCCIHMLHCGRLRDETDVIGAINREFVASRALISLQCVLRLEL